MAEFCDDDSHDFAILIKKRPSAIARVNGRINLKDGAKPFRAHGGNSTPLTEITGRPKGNPATKT